MDDTPVPSDSQTSGSNTFVNDGSFLEQFKKMQQQKHEKDKAQDSSTSSSKTSGFSSVPLMSASNSRVTKSGAVVMKLSGIKKHTDKRRKPADVGVKKAFKGSSSSESEGEEESSKFQRTVIATSSGVGGGGGGASMMTVGSTASGTVSTVQVPTAHSSPAVVSGQKRKRVSRWGVQPQTSSVPSQPPSGKMVKEDVAISAAIASFSGAPTTPQQQDLSEAQQQQLREQIEMNKLVAEIRTAQQKYASKKPPGKKNVYEYDSDEDTEGGTWEHKKRKQEMYETEFKAVELTEKGKGKHHIGDFLPPEELEKFIEKAQAIKEDRDPDFSDYKAHKLTEENVGFRMLQKAGWKEGAGLGSNEDGITAPINKGKRSFDQAGVGAEVPGEVKKEDDMFDVYRKRMMLAYRFRPNPLNNPRRPYY